MVNDANQQYMLMAKIGNEYTMKDRNIAIDHHTTLTEAVEWVKSKGDHLDEELYGR